MEGGKTGAEIVDGELEAVCLQIDQELLQQRQVLHRIAFGDLEHDALGRHAVFRDDAPYFARELVQHQRPWRQIDEDFAPVPLRLQGFQRPLQHQQVEAVDDAHFFGQFDKFVGTDHLPGQVDARQHLVGGNPLAPDIENGLEVGDDTLVLDRRHDHLALLRQVAENFHHIVGGGNSHLVLTRCLGPIHHVVGKHQQILGVVGMFGVHRQTNRRRAPQADIAVDRHFQPIDRGTDPLRHQHHGIQSGLRQERHKLVTTITRQHVALA